MAFEAPTERFAVPLEVGRNVRSALVDLLSQEYSCTIGHLTALLNGCLFAPSILTFWFVNGLLDFSTAIVMGSLASPAGLLVRLSPSRLASRRRVLRLRGR